MDVAARLIGIFAITYVIGALPTAVIASRLVAGIDVRELGTRNPGAANIFREVDPRVGVIVAIIDISKALIPVLIVDRALNLGPSGATTAALGALWGHQFSVFLRFRGGAGLAPAMGGVAGLMLGPTLLAAIVGLPMLLLTRNMGWTGGVTMGVAFVITGLLVWTDVPFPAVARVEAAGYLYGGALISLLLALHFWRRRLGELRAARGADAACDAASTTEGQK